MGNLTNEPPTKIQAAFRSNSSNQNWDPGNDTQQLFMRPICAWCESLEFDLAYNAISLGYARQNLFREQRSHGLLQSPLKDINIYTYICFIWCKTEQYASSTRAAIKEIGRAQPFGVLQTLQPPCRLKKRLSYVILSWRIHVYINTYMYKNIYMCKNTYL